MLSKMCSICPLQNYRSDDAMMIHKPIQFQNLTLSFPHKVCFEDFSAQIHCGDRIAIIGRNGSGKSTLLQLLQGVTQPTSGTIDIPPDVRMGYVPQIIEQFESLSGGQRLNEALTQALRTNPNVLLLDEPTNHLDRENRKSLLRLLRAYTGTLIVVSHDVELLRTCVDTLWHIDDEKIHIFTGHYDDYIREIGLKRASIEQALSYLQQEKHEVHHALMREQTRAAKSRTKGKKSIEQRKWPTVVSNAKADRASGTTGRKKAAIAHRKEELTQQLSELHLSEIILPQFSLNAADVEDRVLLSVSDGSVGYRDRAPLLQDIHLVLNGHDRVTIFGRNGSGKSTLVKAILNDPTIRREGNWNVPRPQEIGYLDQHYQTLVPERSVLETIEILVPSWSPVDIRRHLSDFLFRKNEEVHALVSTLSGGEKARLTLAQIAAKTPRLLILDEISNNVDLETREHMIQVLNAYPGAMIVISHDEPFLRALEIHICYTIDSGKITQDVF